MKSSYTNIKNKTILITGGTGSFGNTVVTRLLPLEPKRIIIFSRDEKKQFDMRNSFDNQLLKFIIGDIRDENSVMQAMVNVDYVFHAAALKQVPTGEFFPMETIKTNILGANNVVKAALSNKVKKVIALSTDKAVYPINVMGMSKAIMEKIFLAEAKRQKQEEGRTLFCVVRYGNVLYTRGSVIPYFINQMKQNKKLPVTHFGMTRFLLPLPQAIELVLYALSEGEGGSTYVCKSPATTMETLAKSMCSMFNYEKGYYEVGTRAGEKMHETLITHEEMVRAKDLGMYYQILPESHGLDYNQYLFHGKKVRTEKYIPFTSENTERLGIRQTIKMLTGIPEIKGELSK